MDYKIESTPTVVTSGEVSLRCPVCKQNGTFYSFNDIHDLQWFQKTPLSEPNRLTQMQSGIRVCPNRDCSAIVYTVTMKGKLHNSYPPETIEFDTSNLPTKIVSVLSESIQAYAAGCYRASALMVRRLLEEVCDDRNIVGKDLYDRLAKLGAGSLIPSELIEAAHELRLLGNDAAHIKSKNYDVIGKQEIEASIDLAKEILKAIYQYSDLVDRLRRLKNPPANNAG